MKNCTYALMTHRDYRNGLLEQNRSNKYNLTENSNNKNIIIHNYDFQLNISHLNKEYNNIFQKTSEIQKRISQKTI